MGDTFFAFRIEERNLRLILAQIEKEKWLYPGHTWGWELSVELIPDGIGYDVGNLSQRIVSDDRTECVVSVSLDDDSTGSLN